MARPNDPPVRIPPFAKPLAPYIKPRQETLRIRQALTSYLRSFIVFTDDDAGQSNYLAQSHIALCAPTDAVVNVKRIPSDITGLRKNYLEALQANVAARKDFASASEEIASKRRQRASRNRQSDADLKEPGAALRDYLMLLRDRRRHTKLQVFQHYLEEVVGRDGADLESLDVPEDTSQQVLVSEGLEAEGPDPTGGDTDLEGLVHKLERAVVRSRAQLDREKQLLEEVKSKGEVSQREISPAVKARALQKTRDELVQWVEERLVGGGDPDESILQELPPEEIEEAQRVLDERKAQIAEQYAAYVQARRDLLEAAARACQPVTVAPKPPSRSTYKEDILTEERPPPCPMDVLSFSNETLLPLSKSQKALALQKSYLSGLLSKEKSETLRALNRLNDESHLLPEYPILARQARFQHAVAALNSRNQSQSDQNKSDEVALAEAWAFASEAAATNERDFVQQKLALGTEIARDARKTLRDVYGTVNQDLDEVMREEQEVEQDVSDIWASQARPRGYGKAGLRLEKRKGPWSGLNGRVGVE